MTIVSIILEYVIAGFIGFLVSKKVKYMPVTFDIIVLVIMVIVSQWIFPGIRLIAISQFELYANHTLQGFIAGVLMGMLQKK